jgi:hypothetical protein
MFVMTSDNVGFVVHFYALLAETDTQEFRTEVAPRIRLAARRRLEQAATGKLAIAPDAPATWFELEPMLKDLATRPTF